MALIAADPPVITVLVGGTVFGRQAGKIHADDEVRKPESNREGGREIAKIYCLITPEP